MAELGIVARAKINLALHVTGQRDDGMHLLESLVVFADHGDRLKVSANPDTNAPLVTLNCSGPFAGEIDCADEDNLVVRAANMLAKAIDGNGDGNGEGASAKLYPVTLHLEKNLPVASGIGGGSADAAACLKLLSRLWHFHDEEWLFTIAAELGADIPMCLASKPLRATGTGTEFTLVDGPGSLPLVLVNCGDKVSTPSVFKALTNKSNPPLPKISETSPFDLEWLRQSLNDLEPPAISVCPQIGETLKALEAIEGCQLARMSGSGATCFGIFDTADGAAEAATLLSAERPDWWVIATSAGNQ